MSAASFPPHALTFLTHPERRQMAAAWPMVKAHVSRAVMMRRWAKVAGVRLDAVKLHADVLFENGLVLENGTIPPEVSEFLGAAALVQIQRGSRR